MCVHVFLKYMNNHKQLIKFFRSISSRIASNLRIKEVKVKVLKYDFLMLRLR